MTNNKITVTSFSLPKRLFDKLDAESKENMRSRSGQLALILNNYYKNKEG